MTISSRIDIHETFRSGSSTARLPRGIFQNVRNSMQRRCQVLNLHLSFFHTSFLGFGWTRVAINSGLKEPKGHVKEKTRELVTKHNMDCEAASKHRYRSCEDKK
ncbi:hypothetical protein TNCV_2569771 [Trichonephila clavipes]|nr:hypothetical protein TNCV_2569771 [Trichonephila clavipes]